MVVKKYIMMAGISGLLLSTSLMAQSYTEVKKEAYKEHHAGHTARAISKVEAFISQHPESYKGENLLAVLYYWNGDVKKSKSILEHLLAKHDYDESRKLLKIVEKKLGTHKSYRSAKKDNKRSQLTDLEYLVKQVDKNPQDVHNRVMLAKFYFKIEEYQKAYDMAHDVLILDPHNHSMKKISKILSSQYKIAYSGTVNDESALSQDKAHKLLNQLASKKEYKNYLNLFHELEKGHGIISQEEYIDALHASIMQEDYQGAKELLSKGVIPINKEMLKVQLLLAQKLSTKVASN